MATIAQVKSIFLKNGHISRTMRNWMVEFIDQILCTPVAVTATANGLTTGLIPETASFVAVTSANAAHQVSLPAAAVGKKISVLVGANGCEVISSVATHKVNNVVVGATNEAAIPANTLVHLEYVATDIWVMVAYTNLGAVVTAIVPDAL